MPELPEVESVRRALEGGLTGRRVCAARLLTPDVVAHPDAGAFCAALTDRRFAALSRRGKFLVAALDDGARLVVHLRMTGRLLLVPAREAPEAYTRAVFALDDGQELRFADMRRFGRLWLLRAGGNLQDQGSLLFDGSLSDALDDLHVVYVESADSVTAVVSLLKHLGSGDNRHLVHSFPNKSLHLL